MLNELQKEIIRLKEEKNAIILAHNYQPKEIQEIADFLGDSLELCIKASQVTQDIIVFCGVDFMAETAYILNPDKKILIPDNKAECPMAHMVPLETLMSAREEYPDAAVVLYVNTLAESKSVADVLCTSANAPRIVNSLDEDTIIFGPDANLGNYVRANTDKTVICAPEDGHCYVHKMFTVEDVEKAREAHPDAKLLVHPECNPEIQDLADEMASTGGMIRAAEENPDQEYLIATEIDMITRIKMEVPDSKVYPVKSDAICKTMKLHTLEKVLDSLKNEEYQITLDRDIVEKSAKAVQRMLDLS